MSYVRYHRSLLTPSEALLYDSAERVMRERKHSIEIPGRYDHDTIVKCLRALERDIPDLQMYLYGSYFSYAKSDSVVVLYPHFRFSPKVEQKKRDEVSKAVKAIVAKAKRYKTEYEQELCVHDCILDGLTYKLDEDPDSEVYAASGALLNKVAVCKGSTNK